MVDVVVLVAAAVAVAVAVVAVAMVAVAAAAVTAIHESGLMRVSSDTRSSLACWRFHK